MATGETFERLVAEMWKMGHENHVIELTDAHESSAVEMMFRTMIKHGWRINAIYLHTNYNGEEYVDIKNDRIDVLSAFFDALVTDPKQAGAAFSYGELFGWHDESFFNHSRYGRPYLENFVGVYGAGEYEREIVGMALENMDIPSWVSVDYEATFQALDGDYCIHEFAAEVYVWPNH